MESKYCTGCEKDHPIEEFAPRKDSKIGMAAACKEWNRKQRRERRRVKHKKGNPDSYVLQKDPFGAVA